MKLAFLPHRTAMSDKLRTGFAACFAHKNANNSRRETGSSCRPDFHADGILKVQFPGRLLLIF